MFKRFSFKTKYLASFLCVAYMGAANAAEPIILNNAELTTNYSAYGFHQNAEVDTPIGLASHENAVQQTMIIDKNNIKYSAYMSTEDDRLYALKFVNNQWVSAADGNGEDGLVETVGDVAPLLDGSTGPLVDDGDYTRFSKTVLLTTGANGEIYLGYLDEVGGTDDAEGDNNLHIFELVTVDGSSSWQLLTTLKLMGEGSLDGSIYNVHDMELEVDSSGNIYALFNTYRPALGNRGRVYYGQNKVAKYTKSTNAWQKLGDTYTSIAAKLTANQQFFPSAIALSPTDELYFAYSSYVESLDASNMDLKVLKLDEAAVTWSEVGNTEDRQALIGIISGNYVHNAIFTLDLAIAPSGKLFLATHTYSKYLAVVTYDPFEEVDAEKGEVPVWKIPYATNGGSKLDEINELGSGRNIRPAYNLTIAVGSDDLPYVAYGEFANDTETKSIVLLGIKDELNVDNEIVSNWIPYNIPLAEATTSDTAGTTPNYINLALSTNNRPHLLYRDEAGNDHSRALRADVRNSSELIELSVVEEEFDAGNVIMEIAGTGDPRLYSEYTFGNHPDVAALGLNHLELFDASDLADGKLTLKQEGDFLVGANINFPYLLVDVYGTDLATGDKSHEEPVTVQVSFEPSTDPEIIAKRGFAFAAYLCGDDPSKCTIDINEDDSILFQYIQSKIENYTLTGGELPDGITFDVTDPTAGFEGKASFTSTAGIDDVAQYNFSVTANPEEGSVNNGTEVPATPVTINMTINVTNTPIHVEADYMQTINENDFLSVFPTVDVATEFFDIVWHTDDTGEEGEVVGTDFSWLKFDRLTGEISGQSRYIHAGVYRGTVYASGYDEGERDDDRLAFDVEIVVTNVPMYWPTGELGEVNYTISENDSLRLTYERTAVQYFYVKAGSTLPDFLQLNVTTGQLYFTPDFEDENEEPYTFTLVAQGWDAGVEGEYLELIVNLKVDHTNAPPSLEKVLGGETEGVNPIFIDLLSYAYDVDAPGNKDSYNGQVIMVFEDDEFYADYTIPELDEDGNQVIDDDGNPVFLPPVTVENSDGDDIVVEHSHNGLGTLEIVANGLIYTPSPDDAEIVKISYVLKDNEGLYQDGETAIRVNAIKEANFDQESKGGSMGSLLALFAFMLTIRLYKRKA